MKIVLISDTHNMHRKVTDLEEADMIIHAGDISDRGELNQVYDFLNWFTGLPYKYKVFIAGNHDFSFEDSRKNKIREALIQHPDIIYLEDEEIVIEGIKIYGSPWTPRFYDWAFNADRGRIIKEEWDKIPLDTDILITHGPPYGYGDMCAHGGRVGCKDLLKRLLEVRPKLCIFGHIHEGWGTYKIPLSQHVGFRDSVVAINASILDERYKLTHHPITINYEDYM